MSGDVGTVTAGREVESPYTSHSVLTSLQDGDPVGEVGGQHEQLPVPTGQVSTTLR